MDITVTPASGGKTWQLTDLLGRSMGWIEETEPGVFYIRPANRAIQTMDGMRRGHPSLDAALINAVSLCPFDTLTLALLDEAALHLRHHAQHGHDDMAHFTAGTRRAARIRG